MSIPVKKIETAPGQTQQPKMREWNEEEAERLINDVANFYDYTLALAEDPEATSTYFDVVIPPDSANALIENTFNYYFARQNDKLVDEVYDTLTVELQFSNGEISTKDVGLAFNDLRSDLKDFMDNHTNGEAEFTLADAEVEVSGSIALIRLVGVFGQVDSDNDFENFPAFNSSDKWSIWEKGGKFGTSIYDNKYGAPEILTLAINGDINLYTYSYMVNITNYSVGPVVPSNPQAYYLPSTYSAGANPMHTFNSTYWTNTIIHCVYYGQNPFTDKDWVIPSAMSYYRTWLRIAAANTTTANNKTLRNIKIETTTIPSGGNYPVLHYFSMLRGGDVVIPASDLPSSLSL